MRQRHARERRIKKLIERAAGVLWTGVGSPPWGWVMLQMRKLYRCTPSQLEAEDFETVMQDFRLEMLERRIASQK